MTSDFVPALRFRILTRFYDPVVRLTTRERTVKSALIDYADVPQGATVVDLGCGTGTLTIGLKRKYPGARVIGLDADPAILEFAKAKADVAGIEVEFVESNASDIPFASGSVDRIVSSLFFHHLQPGIKKRVLFESFRILTEDGELHISDWGRPENILMRLLFYPVQLLDGFSNTRDNVQGLLPDMVMKAGAGDVAEMARFSTMFGTLRLLRAIA